MSPDVAMVQWEGGESHNVSDKPIVEIEEFFLDQVDAVDQAISFHPMPPPLLSHHLLFSLMSLQAQDSMPMVTGWMVGVCWH